MVHQALGRFFKVAAIAANIVVLNLLWLITSLPIITVFPSTFAAYAVVQDWKRDENGAVIGPYFQAWKKQFARSYMMGVPTLGIGLIIYVELRYFGQAHALFGYLMLGLVASLALIYICCSIYLLPLAVQANLSVGQTMKTALYVGIRKILPTCLLILPIWLISIGLGIAVPFLGIVCLVSLTFWLTSLLTGKHIAALFG
ncbi:YesL family protein [Alicyclobacillus fodiniaquatilis]|uniref:YesL family protein n=1 Tax=Alicyclobacillus fodiniaquatilis TaxID=1661150 RepID=A0ABW4JCT0_9BACL